jgi:hypothetical protein
MHFFRNINANLTASSNGDLLHDISEMKAKTKDPTIQNILEKCSEVILILNNGRSEEKINIEDFKKELSQSSFYKKSLGGSIFDSTRSIYHIIQRTLKALPLDPKSRANATISKDGYITPRIATL